MRLLSQIAFWARSPNLTVAARRTAFTTIWMTRLVLWPHLFPCIPMPAPVGAPSAALNLKQRTRQERDISDISKNGPAPLATPPSMAGRFYDHDIYMLTVDSPRRLALLSIVDHVPLNLWNLPLKAYIYISGWPEWVPRLPYLIHCFLHLGNDSDIFVSLEQYRLPSL